MVAYTVRKQECVVFCTTFEVLSARKIDSALCAVSNCETYHALSCDLFAPGQRETAEMESEAHTRNYTVFSFFSLRLGNFWCYCRLTYLTFSFFLSFVVFNRLNQWGMPPKLHVKRPNARAVRKRREKMLKRKREMGRKTAKRNNSV